MNKKMHFWHSILSLKASLFASAILIFVAICITIYWGESKTGVALLVGIVSSVVATSVLRVFDKYCESVRAYENLQYDAREFLDAFSRYKGHVYFAFSREKITFVLRQQYFQMCIHSRNILYQADALAITGCVHGIILAFRYNLANIENEVNKLNNVLKCGAPR